MDKTNPRITPGRAGASEQKQIHELHRAAQAHQTGASEQKTNPRITPGRAGASEQKTNPRICTNLHESNSNRNQQQSAANSSKHSKQQQFEDHTLGF